MASLTGTIDVVDAVVNEAVPVEQPAKPVDFSMNPDAVAHIIAAAKQAEELKKQQQAELAKSFAASSLQATLAAATAAAATTAPTLPSQP